MTESMLGRWADLYEGAHERRAYGFYSPTYQAAAGWLSPCFLIEDWGGGLGWFRRYVEEYAPRLITQRYRCIDGTATMFVDEVADLRTYKPAPKPDGILLRHVLEHNAEWVTVLENMLGSFRKRACVVVYTPFGDRTRDLGEDRSGLDVPVISFAMDDLRGVMGERLDRVEVFTGPTCGHYQVETVFYLEQRP